MSEPMEPLDHVTVDELGAALALGALDPDELRAVTEHLERCPEPHAEVRSFLGAGDVLAASLEPVPPSPELRDRLMTTVSTTSQEHAEVGSPVPPAAAPAIEPSRRGLLDWFSPRLARPLAVVGLVVALVFGIWNASLRDQLNTQGQALEDVARAIASAQKAFRVSPSSGTAPSGYLVADSSGMATLIVAGLTPLDANKIYELWLIGSDNKPVAVGTFVPSGDEVTAAHLDRPISGFSTFAVTAESKRVDAPTSQPVMSAQLGG